MPVYLLESSGWPPLPVFSLSNLLFLILSHFSIMNKPFLKDRHSFIENSLLKNLSPIRETGPVAGSWFAF